jgi:hypothetical protein
MEPDEVGQVVDGHRATELGHVGRALAEPVAQGVELGPGVPGERAVGAGPVALGQERAQHDLEAAGPLELVREPMVGALVGVDVAIDDQGTDLAGEEVGVGGADPRAVRISDVVDLVVADRLA